MKEPPGLEPAIAGHDLSYPLWIFKNFARNEAWKEEGMSM